VRAYEFDDRINSHEQFRARVAAFFRENGCVVHTYGVERMDKEFHQALLRCGADPTARFLRFQPDEALVILDQRRAHLCEVKSTLPDTRTGNFAYELASIETALLMDSIGISVFVVFSGFKATWLKEIRFQRTFTDPAYLATIKRGARTPFGIFSQDAPFLRPLEQFAVEELKCSL